MLSILNDEARRHIGAIDKINFTTSLKSDHTVTPESEIPKWHYDAHSSNAMWSLPPLSHQLWHCLKIHPSASGQITTAGWPGFQEGSSAAIGWQPWASKGRSAAGIPPLLLTGSSTSSGTSAAPGPRAAGLPSLDFHLTALEKMSSQVKSKCICTPQLPLWAAPSLHVRKC